MPYNDEDAAFDAVNDRLTEATRRAESVVYALNHHNKNTYAKSTLASLIQLRNDIDALRAVVLKREPEAAIAKGGSDE